MAKKIKSFEVFSSCQVSSSLFQEKEITKPDANVKIFSSIWFDLEGNRTTPHLCLFVCFFFFFFLILMFVILILIYQLGFTTTLLFYLSRMTGIQVERREKRRKRRHGVFSVWKRKRLHIASWEGEPDLFVTYLPTDRPTYLPTYLPTNVFNHSTSNTSFMNNFFTKAAQKA